MFFGKEAGMRLNHAVETTKALLFDTIRMTKLVTAPAAPPVGAGVRPNNRGELSPLAGRKKIRKKVWFLADQIRSDQV